MDRGAAALSIESTKPPPSEPPRGIVAPYQPKDDPSGPAVVLKDDVLAMEEAQAATEELLREHAVSSRRAPTIMNLKPPSVSAYPGPTADFTAKRSKRPLVIGGIVLALGAALIVVVAFAFKGGSTDAPAAPVSQVASVVTSPVAAPAALEVPPPLPPEAPAEEPAARESEVEPRAAAANAKPTVKKSAPKAPSKAGAKPASGATAPAPKKSGVIVRDTPF